MRAHQQLQGLQADAISCNPCDLWRECASRNARATMLWRVVRVAEGARLEIVYTSKAYPGFKSRTLRHYIWRQDSCAAMCPGGVAEWSNAAVSKTVYPVRGTRVRIPPPPPYFFLLNTPIYLYIYISAPLILLKICQATTSIKRKNPKDLQVGKVASKDT